MVLPPEPPCVTVTLEGEADKVKLGAGLTVKLRVVVFVSVPEIPVMVTVAVPVAAVAPAVSVSELVVVVVAGLKFAVTPEGRPEADRLTLPVNPFCGVIVTVLGPPAAPCVSVTLAGDAPSVKFGEAAALTVSEIVVVWVSAPEMPVTVAVEVPVAAVALAVSVRVLVVVALAGLKDAVTPFGKPDADRATLPVNPFWGAIEIVLVPPAAPCVIETLAGAADSVKVGAGAAFTVKLRVVVFVKLAEVPVSVTVTGPVTAEALAVNVRTLEVGELAGAKLAVTPDGKPEAEKVTAALNPFCGVTAMVLVPLAPCVIVRLLGAAESVKFAGGGAFGFGQLLTRFAALTLPIPVAKSQPVVALKAGK